MAKNKKNYKLDGDIIKADLLKLTDEEIAEINKLKLLGYKLEKWNRSDKKSPSKDEMLDALKGIDEQIAKDFEICLALKTKSSDEEKNAVKKIAEKYGVKTTTKAGKEYAGYHIACQIYSKNIKTK